MLISYLIILPLLEIWLGVVHNRRQDRRKLFDFLFTTFAVNLVYGLIVGLAAPLYFLVCIVTIIQFTVAAEMFKRGRVRPFKAKITLLGVSLGTIVASGLLLIYK